MLPGAGAGAQDGAADARDRDIAVTPGGWTLPPPQLGATIIELLVGELVSSQRFHVYDGQWLVPESEADGHVNLTRLREAAASRHVDYLVLGSVTAFSTAQSRSRTGGVLPKPLMAGAFSRQQMQMAVGMTFRIVDVRTGEVVTTATAKGLRSVIRRASVSSVCWGLAIRVCCRLPSRIRRAPVMPGMRCSTRPSARRFTMRPARSRSARRASNPVDAPPRGPVFSGPVRWIVRGDIDGFFGLALDNLVQLLLIDSLCRFVLGFPPELVYGRVLPGAAVSILVGNIFYSWQAKKLAARTGRTDVCALPYGINTVSLIAHVFLVMLPAKALAMKAGLPTPIPSRVAWQAGLVATLCSGLIELAGAFVAERVRRSRRRAPRCCPRSRASRSASFPWAFSSDLRAADRRPDDVRHRDAHLLRARAFQGPDARRDGGRDASARISALDDRHRAGRRHASRLPRCIFPCRSSAI